MNKIQSKIIGTTLGLTLIGGLLFSPHSADAATNNVLTQTEAQHIISKAEQIQNRVQYHFGVNDPSKMWFDCSSFTKYLFKQQGIDLRWGARKQYTDGIKISKSQLRPGDLVFFSTPATVNRTSTYDKIGHVGIYIGNGKVIHDVSPKYDVLISSINSGWWKTHYVAAARVVTHASSAPAASISSASKTGTVVSSVAFLNSPSVHGTRFRYLQKGEKFTILNKVNPWWYQIKDHNGKIGYVTTMTRYVRA